MTTEVTDVEDAPGVLMITNDAPSKKPINGRRLQRALGEARWRVIWVNEGQNRKARRSGGGLTSDHKEVMSAMRSTPRAFQRSP